MRRLPLILALIHAVLMTSLIVREEWKSSQFYPYMQRSEDVARYVEEHPPTPSNSVVGWDCNAVDYWPSYPLRAVYMNNSPLALTYGYYSHPLSSCSAPDLVSVVNERTPMARVRVVPKVWIYNTLFVLLVAAQWWLIGRWALLPGRKLVKSCAIALTSLAGLLTVLALPNRDYAMTNPLLWAMLTCILVLPALWFGLLILGAIEAIPPLRRLFAG